MYIYIYVYIYIHTYIFVYIHTYMHIYIYVYIYIYICTHTHTHTYICIYIATLKGAPVGCGMAGASPRSSIAQTGSTGVKAHASTEAVRSPEEPVSRRD